MSQADSRFPRSRHVMLPDGEVSPDASTAWNVLRRSLPDWYRPTANHVNTEREVGVYVGSEAAVVKGQAHLAVACKRTQREGTHGTPQRRRLSCVARQIERGSWGPDTRPGWSSGTLRRSTRSPSCPRRPSCTRRGSSLSRTSSQSIQHAQGCKDWRAADRERNGRKPGVLKAERE